MAENKKLYFDFFWKAFGERGNKKETLKEWGKLNTREMFSLFNWIERCNQPQSAYPLAFLKSRIWTQKLNTKRIYDKNFSIKDMINDSDMKSNTVNLRVSESDEETLQKAAENLSILADEKPSLSKAIRAGVNILENNSSEKIEIKEKFNYTELLSHPKWQRKRLEIMQRDDFKCCLCNDDETTLHIHHKSYINGNKPWEYENSYLITLCEHCHTAVEFYKKINVDILHGRVLKTIDLRNSKERLLFITYNNSIFIFRVSPDSAFPLLEIEPKSTQRLKIFIDNNITPTDFHIIDEPPFA